MCAEARERGSRSIGYARDVRTFALGTFVLWIAPAMAQADAIMGPPVDCAPGSQAMSSHWGSWCEDTTCASDADCPPFFELRTQQPIQRLCRSVSVCVPEGTTAATGPRTLDSPRGAYRGPGRPVSGTCERDGTCREGICDTAPRCVIQAAADSPPAPLTPTTSPAPPTSPRSEPATTPPPTTTTSESPTSSGSSCAVTRWTDTHAGWLCLLAALAVLAARSRKASGR